MLTHNLQRKPFGRCTTIKPLAKIDTPLRVIYCTGDEERDALRREQREESLPSR